MFFTICLPIVALENFRYVFIFDISKKSFSHFDVDNASELIPQVGLFVKFLLLISSFSYLFPMHLKKIFEQNLDYLYWFSHHTKM